MSEKNKAVWLAGLIAVAVFVWFFERRGPSAAVNGASAAAFSYRPLGVENPALQRERLDRSRKTEYKSAGRDLFSAIVIPPPDPTPKDVPREPIGPVVPLPPPPPALPVNVKFFGYGTVPNGTAKLAFLSDGDQVYIVAEGETLLGKYRVVKIGNANLDFEEIATGRRGSTSLSDEPMAPAS
jgi:hypothetical protein